MKSIPTKCTVTNCHFHTGLICQLGTVNSTTQITAHIINKFTSSQIYNTLIKNSRCIIMCRISFEMTICHRQISLIINSPTRHNNFIFFKRGIRNGSCLCVIDYRTSIFCVIVTKRTGFNDKRTGCKNCSAITTQCFVSLKGTILNG